MQMDLEITKSPSGYLKPNAEISGWLTLTNIKDKPEELEKISVVLMELWDEKVSLGPTSNKYIHDEKVIFKRSNQVSKVVFDPGMKKRWEFTFKLPWSFPCSTFLQFQDDPISVKNWHISVVGIASRGKLRNDVVELVAPVTGTKVKPMWFFEPGETAKPDQTGKNNYCPCCGATVKAEAKVCDTCGVDL